MYEAAALGMGIGKGGAIKLVVKEDSSMPMCP